jgi:hypothetical protein
MQKKLFYKAGSLFFLRKLYHRERIYFSSTLSGIKKEEKITKPPKGA